MSDVDIKTYAKSLNVACLIEKEECGEEKLTEIGQSVLLGYREDKQSMAEWLDDICRIEELAGLKAVRKSTPLPNSANVKLPLITKACYEYVSRVSPEIIKDGSVVQTQIIGPKTEEKVKQSNNCVTYMNWQLLYANTDWTDQLDTLLFRTALIGFMCKKTFYDDVEERIKQIICDPKDLIVNMDIKSIQEAPRVSHVLRCYMNELVQGANTGDEDCSVYLESAVDELREQYKEDKLNCVIELIEQCTYLDLDEDGYKEPYIVTVRADNGKVLRIVARFDKDDVKMRKGKVRCIEPIEIYEDYHFLPNPNGKFISVGFGILLLYITETCNSSLNQLLDSGQLANMKGGYMDARFKVVSDGNSLHDPGEFKKVKIDAHVGGLKDGVLPIEFGEPSTVMFSLLNLLIEVARDLSSSTQINNGTQSSENAKTGATQLLMQSGEKLFGFINTKFYRSLTKELRHIFDLNARYLSPQDYYDVLEDRTAVQREDFDKTKINIIPVADPNLASKQQRLQEAAFVQQYVLSGLPADPLKAAKFILDRVNIPGVIDILPVPDEGQQKPDPTMLKLQAEIEESGQKLSLEGRKADQADKQMMINAMLAEAQIKKLECECVALLAKAESEDAKLQLQDYQLQLQAISKKIDTEMNVASMLKDNKNQEADRQQERDLSQVEVPTNEEEGAAGVPGALGSEGATGVDPTA